MTDINKVLNNRGKRYGNYLKQTQISAAILRVIRFSPHLWRLDPDQEDALHMIAVKIARILNGDPHHADSWRDIAGYATLVADRLDGKERP